MAKYSNSSNFTLEELHTFSNYGTCEVCIMIRPPQKKRKRFDQSILVHTIESEFLDGSTVDML
jgi:hypothetical protein